MGAGAVVAMLGSGTTKWFSCGGATGTRTGPGGAVAVAPAMLGSGTTEGFPNGGAAGARMGTGGGVAAVPVVLGSGTTEGFSNGGAAGARTGTGGGVTVVPVMLGSGETEGFPKGGAAGAKIGARSSGANAIVRVGMPVRVRLGMGAWSGPFLLTSFESISPTSVASVTTIGGAAKPAVPELAGGIVSAP